MATGAVRRLLLRTTDADARVLFNAMAVRPGNSRQRLISSTIRSLKAAGVWSKLDALYMTAAHDSQAALLNWRAPGTWSLVPTNSPTFTVDRGFKGDGATSYLTANGYNPSTAGASFAQDSACCGMWIQQTPTVTISRVISMANATLFSLGATATNYNARLNDSTGGTATPNSTLPGHWAMRRLDSAGKDIWEDGVQHTAKDASTSTAMGSSMTLLASPTPGAFCDGRIAAAYTAGGLTDAQMAAMDTCLRSYMQGVGVV